MFGKFTKRLSKSSAEFVDVVHTTGKMVSIHEPLGHVDFYPNGGSAPQPGKKLILLIRLYRWRYRGQRTWV